MIRRILLLLLLFALPLSAQTVPQVAFDVIGFTPAQVQAWTATLYVNAVPFVLTDTCVANGALTTCTAPLPNISSALTATGNQSFTVSLKDSVLGEGLPSPPLVKVRPGAPSVPRIQ